MAKLNQELTSELGIEVKIIEGKTYEYISKKWCFDPRPCNG